jgi:hypothetical protein
LGTRFRRLAAATMPFMAMRVVHPSLLRTPNSP